MDEFITNNGIVLGFPFDQLFDQECPLQLTPTNQRRPGIVVPGTVEPAGKPKHRSPGTGNIVICGAPGSGKSTLALQFAVMCARRPENGLIPAYVALENSPNEIIEKARPFGWEESLAELRYLHGPETFPDRNPSDILLHILTQPRLPESHPACGVIDGGKVNKKACTKHKDEYKRIRKSGWLKDLDKRAMLVSLSPRPLPEGDEGEAFFWKRFHQLEFLLAAGHGLRKRQPEGARPVVFPLVVVDSLNTFANWPVTRDQLSSLFSLFRRYDTVGVFTVESTLATPFDSTLADVVISLTDSEDSADNDYFVRYIEIEKSRYRNHVVGRHPFKPIRLLNEGVKRAKNSVQGGSGNLPCTPCIPNRHGNTDCGDPPRHGIVVYPSLHYIVNMTEEGNPAENPKDKVQWKQAGKRWGVTALDRVLPPNLKPVSVFAIEGPRGTFKTSFAVAFLARGLALNESAILIRLHGSPLLSGVPASAHWPNLSEDVINGNDGDEDHEKSPPFRWEDLERVDTGEARQWQNLFPRKKALISVWRKKPEPKESPDGDSGGSENPPGESGAGAHLFEVDFRSGALLPEEFVHLIRDILIRRPKEHQIRRVVLDDVSEIGLGYPCLRQSKSSGDIFLSALAHVMRNHGADLVMTGTSGDLEAANEAVNRACTVADTVLSCRFCDVFGRRHVVILGERLIARSDSELGAASGSSPPVVENTPFPVNDGETHRAFSVKPDFLEGLVGLDKGNVHRPGVVFHAFEDYGNIHGAYNRDIEMMLTSALACPPLSLAAPSGALRAADQGPIAYHPSEVCVLGFNSALSEAMHDSLHVLTPGAPIDKTVLYTVDEFAHIRKGPEGSDPKSKCFFELRASDVGVKVETLVDQIRESYKENEPSAVWPYYLNVLLLAYRVLPDSTGTDPGEEKPILSEERPKSWKTVKAAAEAIFCGRVGADPPIRRPCWYDHSASETLSCLLMDALAAANMSSGKELNDVLYREREVTLSAGELSELKALSWLLQNVRVTSRAQDREARPPDVREKVSLTLPPDAAVYLCWYSQLRELIDREPELAEQLKVCALPGRGFRGDWYVGIVRGSVSPALGIKAMFRLCRKEEEYKRFSRGVGLPFRVDFYDEKNDFFAWPRARHVKVHQLDEIHANAQSRSEIPHYEQIRSTLSTVASQLSLETGPPFVNRDDKTVEKIIEAIVGRVFVHCKVLGSD